MFFHLRGRGGQGVLMLIKPNKSVHKRGGRPPLACLLACVPARPPARLPGMPPAAVACSQTPLDVAPRLPPGIACQWRRKPLLKLPEITRTHTTPRLGGHRLASPRLASNAHCAIPFNLNFTFGNGEERRQLVMAMPPQLAINK